MSLSERRRLSEQTRCMILADFLEGVPDKVIAERYGCVASYPRVLAKRWGVGRARSLRSKKFHEKRQSRDWLRVSTKHHKARERFNKNRDWLYV